MNILELFEMTKEHIIYLYRPEGRGEGGKVIYHFADKKAIVYQQATDDEFGRYAHKASLKVEECVDKNNLPLRLVQAWN